MSTPQYTLDDVKWWAKEVTRRAAQLIYKIHTLRFRLAKEVLNRLQNYNSRPAVIEVNGYQTYLWVPRGLEREYRVWPYTLTSRPGGWLETRPYAPPGPPVPVSWADIFSKLRANFSINTAVLESIRDLLSMVTQASIEQAASYPEDYSGTVQYGEYRGWYRLAGDGIYVRYFDAGHDRWVEGRIATSESSGCEAKTELKTILSQITSGIQVDCSGTIVSYPYEAPLCSDLDQLVTYVRQLLDKTVFCPFIYPSSILFVDGPLAGLSYTYQATNVAIFYDGRIATLVDIGSLKSMFNTAVQNCANKMKTSACAVTQNKTGQTAQTPP